MTLVSEWKDNFNSGVWTATNMGEAFETFEDAAKFLESVFVWEITSEDVKVL